MVAILPDRNARSRTDSAWSASTKWPITNYPDRRRQTPSTIFGNTGQKLPVDGLRVCWIKRSLPFLKEEWRPFHVVQMS